MSRLNIENANSLTRYLRREGHIGPSEHPCYDALGGGVSNRVVRVRRSKRRTWVLKQALSKLRVAVDWYSDPNRIRREALGLQWLARWLPKGAVPELIFEDADHHLLVMSEVPHPHENWKEQLLAGRLYLKTVRQFGRYLGRIHLGGWNGRDTTSQVFAERAYFETLRLEPYYLYAARQLPAAAPFLRQLTKDCRAQRWTVVHGDYSPKNVLLHRGQLVLLDHEVIHFGDPAFDVGFSMTHFLAKALHVRSRRARFLQACEEYWKAYGSETTGVRWRGKQFEERAVRHTIGCLLARVTGRSPLEYLSPAERACQRACALACLKRRPRLMLSFLAEYAAAMQRTAPIKGRTDVRSH